MTNDSNTTQDPRASTSSALTGTVNYAATIWRTREVIVQELLDKRLITAADAVVLLSSSNVPLYGSTITYTT